jgi:hypothetical protein
LRLRAEAFTTFATLGLSLKIIAAYYLLFERKLTHLLRCCTKLKSSRTTVRSGFSFACALHLGKFLSKHGFSVRH